MKLNNIITAIWYWAVWYKDTELKTLKLLISVLATPPAIRNVLFYLKLGEYFLPFLIIEFINNLFPELLYKLYNCKSENKIICYIQNNLLFCYFGSISVKEEFSFFTIKEKNSDVTTENYDLITNMDLNKMGFKILKDNNKKIIEIHEGKEIDVYNRICKKFSFCFYDIIHKEKIKHCMNEFIIKDIVFNKNDCDFLLETDGFNYNLVDLSKSNSYYLKEELEYFKLSNKNIKISDYSRICMIGLEIRKE